MSSKKRFVPALVIGALALVAVFGAFTYRSVFAQTPTPATPTNPGSSTQGTVPGRPEFGKGFRGGPEGGVSDTDLAAALGIGVDKLQAAYQTANTEALKEAVSKGLITQAQADQWAQNNQANGRPLPFLGPKGAANGIDYDALLAQALGISKDQLTAARTQVMNTNLDNAVKNGTMTQAQADAIKAREALAGNTKFQDSLKSAYQAAVQQAVTDGVITQAQADALLAEQQNAPFFGPGFGGGHGGHGHGGPGFFGQPGNQNGTPATPTTPSNSGSGGA